MGIDMGKLVAALDRVKTPLTLGGLVVIVLYELYSQILKLKIFGQLPPDSTFILVRDIVGYLFWLAVLAVVLGVASYLADRFGPRQNHANPDAPVPLKPIRRPRKPAVTSQASGGDIQKP
jgi:hypothetical protein